MTIKELTQLAKTCRRLGITQLKTSDCEITLGGDVSAPQKRTRKSSTPLNDALFNEPSVDEQQKMPSDSDLLFWSTQQVGDIAS